MNQSVVGRWIPLRIASPRHSASGDARDADDLAQWDLIAAWLRVAETDVTKSPTATEFDRRHQVRRLRPNRAAGRRLSVVSLRKTMITADLGILRCELEAAAARGLEGFVEAIAV